MRPTTWMMVFLAALSAAPVRSGEALDPAAAGRFAALALHCVHREYPNKISHVLASDADVRAPRELTPVFYGCFDWHSSVHGHWLLARLARLLPDAAFTADARAALAVSFTDSRVAAELAYLQAATDAQERVAEPVPLHLRNAPTKLMKALDYGTGYSYAHDEADGVADMPCLPPGLEGRKYYQPRDRGFEKEIKRRLDGWDAIKKRRRTTG